MARTIRSITLHSALTNWFQNLPRVARLTIRREVFASIPLAVAIAVLAGPFCGLIGRKALDMSDSMLALLTATHMAGLLLVGLLIGFFNQKSKITALTITLLALSAVLFGISFIPAANNTNSHLIQSLFLTLAFLGQAGLALAATLRSSLWRANYPASSRGKIVILIYLCITIISSLSVITFSAAMDYLHITFRPVYFVSGIIAILAACLFSRVKLHREKQLLSRLQNNPKKFRLLAGLAVLRDDKPFRQFMSWQMLNGFATLIVESAVLIIIINDVFECTWLTGGAALTAIPLLVSGTTGILWARLFDRSNIFQMRFIGALLWALSRLVLIYALYAGSIEILLISRAFSGLAMGLGQLSWRLGHMHFAPPEKDSLYMAAHISLTGLRGILAPFIGIYLYNLQFMGPHGIWLIALTALAQVVSGFGFLHMQKKNRDTTNRTPAK